MKIVYSWLKDFVEIKIPAQDLAQRLTTAGLEVTSWEEKGGDFVFDIEVTSNRPDCLSVIGIAREVAAVTARKLRLPKNIIFRPKKDRGAKIAIKNEDKDACPLYTAKIIRNIKVAPSPEWLRRRLELLGCRSINNIVDITNYILFEYGEPLHAFDLDKLEGNTICVRQARAGEGIVTIDGQERKLNNGTLVIADAKGPLAIAGVMGGRESEVSENTQNILLEAAVFNPLLVRRARQGLGLITESAYRFERGVDLERAREAAWQAAGMIQELSSGKCVGAKESVVGSPRLKKIKLEVANIEKVLGSAIPAIRTKRILESLGFGVKRMAKGNFMVEVPTWRQDIKAEIDLIEEVARIFGFDFISPTLPPVKPQIKQDNKRDLVSSVKELLVGLGLNEVISYSLVNRNLPTDLDAQEPLKPVEILNPLSSEQEILRFSLAPSLARCTAYNLNQKQEYINIFEIAKIFSRVNNQPQEELVLGVALCGARSLLLEAGLVKESAGLLHLKGILEALFTKLGVKDYSFEAGPGGRINIFLQRENIGRMSALGKEALQKLEIKNKDLFLMELFLDKIFPFTDLRKRFISLSKYPGISRDISLLLKEGLGVSDILKAVREKGAGLLKEVRIVDYYRGRQIPAGYRGLTLSCLYRSDERTLTEAEVSPVHEAICGMLRQDFKADIR